MNPREFLLDVVDSIIGIYVSDPTEIRHRNRGENPFFARWGERKSPLGHSFKEFLVFEMSEQQIVGLARLLAERNERSSYLEGLQSDLFKGVPVWLWRELEEIHACDRCWNCEGLSGLGLTRVDKLKASIQGASH